MTGAPAAPGRVTLDATRRAPRELVRVLAAVALLAALLEALARSDVIRDHLLTPGFGTATRELDLQLAGLARAIRDGGPVDCVVLGSSVVMTGVDPDRVAASYRRRAGRTLHVYAFGVPALEADEAAAVARILFEDYRPRLVVYVFTTRDFFGRNALLPRPRLIDAPWVRYRSGEPSVTGWLVEHSVAYRQLLPYRLLMLPDSATRLGADRRAYRDGFVAFGQVSPDMPPQPPPAFRDLLVPPAATDFEPLHALLRLRNASRNLLLVEMPARPSILDERWTRERYRVFSQVRGTAIGSGVTTLTTIGLSVIPAGGWNDAVHLNARGAAAFGGWLGEQIAERAAVE
jgi:hypothetical protein